MRRFTSTFGTFVLVLSILFLVACQTGPQTPPSIEVVTATLGSTPIPTASKVVEEEAQEEATEEAEEAEEAEEPKAETAETEAEAEASENSDETDASPYPAPDASAYPAPDAYPASENESEASGASSEPSSEPSIDPSKPLEVPAPTDSSKANIGGTLLQQTTQGLQPFEGAVLYLGHLVLDDNGEQTAAGFFEKSSPRTSTNSAGNFLFENVDPREYVLFFWTPQGSVMLLDPSTGEDMIFDLKAGDAINTGSLDYDLTY